jgi:L-fuculose-phosphate aldolase
MTDLADARRDVLDVAHRAASEGLVVGTAGNISVRHGDLVLVTASGAVFGSMTGQHVVAVDLAGRVVDGDVEPTSELDLHLRLHRDGAAGAVVHTHAPASTALGLVMDELPVIHYQQLLLGGAVRVAPYATFGTSELAVLVHESLRDRQAALMANHGSVALGATLAKALDNALLLEWLCRVYLDARTLGDPRELTDDEQAAAIEAAVNRTYGEVKPVPAEKE